MYKTSKLCPAFGARVVANPGTDVSSLQRNEVGPLFMAEGAILFQGFGASKAAFEALTDRLTDEFTVHNSANRGKLDDTGITTTVNYGTHGLGLHRERSYLPGPPDILFLCCLKPPTIGGLTTVCDGVALLASMNAATREFFRNNKLRHDVTLARENWSRAFATTDVATAAATMKETWGGHVGPEEWFDCWPEGDTLRVTYVAPCLPLTKYSTERVFSNGLLFFFDAMYDENRRSAVLGTLLLEDRSEIPMEIYREARRAADELSFAVEWQAGDMLMVDNTRVLHGRTHFEGERDVIVRMGYANFAQAKAA